MNAPSSETVTLRHGVEVGGELLSTLTMRPPLARDSRDAQRGATGQAEAEIRLFANLCEAPVDAIERLHMADYLRLQEAYQRFLG